jgi:hypothetical protein
MASNPLGTAIASLPPAAVASLREALAAALLQASHGAAAETAAWKARAEAAEADAAALRAGVLRHLQVEAGSVPSTAEALAAVSRACRDPGASDADEGYLRQVCIVQAVREAASAPGTGSLRGEPPASDLSSFVCDLLCSLDCTGGLELPRHACAFVDASFRLLAATPGACGTLCSRLAQQLLAYRPGTGGTDYRSAVTLGLARLCTAPGGDGVCAALLASSAALRDACELCAAAQAAERALPFAAPLPTECVDAHRSLANAFFLVRAVEAALKAVPGCSDRTTMLTAMAAFAKTHAAANAKAKSGALEPRYRLLAAAVSRLTAAANVAALGMLRPA